MGSHWPQETEVKFAIDFEYKVDFPSLCSFIQNSCQTAQALVRRTWTFSGCIKE